MGCSGRLTSGSPLPMSFSEIVTAAEGKVHTKQDFETIIARFLKDLVEHKAVKEVS